MATTTDSQDLNAATSAVEAQPDSKTRRYDRQLRLWAATGQTALENARVLVISGSATSTSILKNLVLPGIGHFTILDALPVTPEDAGNNFFLAGPSSIGKPRAVEAVRLLSELNESVEGKAQESSLEEVLDINPGYLTSFTLVIVHNLEPVLLDRLSTFLWSDPTFPALIVVKSAGFLAEFFIQFHEHCIIESHSETAPSLRIDKPFPALLEYATKTLDLSKLDQTDHSHIPYVVILVKALEDWKKSHNDLPPQTYAEKQEFKKSILALRVKSDEENFEEAESQAYRCWTSTTVPSDIEALFKLPAISPPSLTPSSPPFYHLLSALHQYTLLPPFTLPLSSTLPDMKADTTNYIHLQKLYKERAEEEKKTFKSFLKIDLDDSIVDTFVKNAHGIKVLKGTQYGTFDRNREGLTNALTASPKHAATHLALSALTSLTAAPTLEALTEAAQALVGPTYELPDDFRDAAGELVRAPTADLPNTASFVGGLVAQEAIKMITKQYVPVNGYCVVDLVETWTGVVAA